MVGQGAGGGVTVADPQLAARTIAIGVDRGLRHAQLASDLLGAEVPIDQTQTVALPRSQKLNCICGGLDLCAHKTNTLATRVTGRLLVMLRQA